MTIQEIKDSVDIVHIIENYAELTKSGHALKARENPIREERTSSFFVYPDTQKYHDFGTSEGGSVIDFIEQVESLDTHHACLFLSEKYIGSDVTPAYKPPVRRKPHLAELTDQRHKEIVSDIARFDRSDKQTFKDPGYKRSALSIAPMWLYSEAPRHVLEQFNSLKILNIFSIFFLNIFIKGNFLL